MGWKESNRIFTHDQHAGPTVVFAGDGTSGAPPHYAPGQWHTIDLKPLGVSADATFAEISGFLIITDNGPEIDNLTATFRAPDSTLNEGNYQMQAISVFSGDGARQVQSVTVPLVNGCFQFYWQKTVGGVPENGHPSSFLLNLWLSKWGAFVAPAAGASTDLDPVLQQLAEQQASLAEIAARIASLESQPAQQQTVINLPPGGLKIQIGEIVP